MSEDTVMRDGQAVKIEDLPRYERETQTILDPEPDGSFTPRRVPPAYPFPQQSEAPQ